MLMYTCGPTPGIKEDWKAWLSQISGWELYSSEVREQDNDEIEMRAFDWLKNNWIKNNDSGKQIFVIIDWVAPEDDEGLVRLQHQMVMTQEFLKFRKFNYLMSVSALPQDHFKALEDDPWWFDSIYPDGILDQSKIIPWSLSNGAKSQSPIWHLMQSCLLFDAIRTCYPHLVANHRPVMYV